MSRRRSSALRIAVQSVVAGLLTFAVVALVVVLVTDRTPSATEASVPDESIAVDDLVTRAERDVEVIVTGFVFIGEQRSILCSHRDREDPPYCDGQAIDLTGLDPNRLDLVVPDDAPAYSRHEVTLLGSYRLGVLTVQEILQ